MSFESAEKPVGKRRERRLVMGLLAMSACQASAAPPAAQVLSFREVGIIPDPPGTSGRDGGYSAKLAGHSVWAFGDTFLSKPAADGYSWRASTWSWTDDTDASDGLTDWHHGLGADGKPLQLLPHAAAEQAFDDAHNGGHCSAGSDCGARHTLWPASVVEDPQRGALAFYVKENTLPAGSYAFTRTGASVAIWRSPDAPATRPVVANGPDPSDNTELFAPNEPAWGVAAVVDQGLLYAYACAGGNLTSPCLVARVGLGDVFDRSAWRYWDGASWATDWQTAKSIFDGSPTMSIHFSDYLGKWIAFYMTPLSSTFAFRTAPRPEGPWSDEARFGEGASSGNGTWDYAFLAHHELARAGGRVEYLSYYQPGKLFDGKIHLVEVTFR